MSDKSEFYRIRPRAAPAFKAYIVFWDPETETTALAPWSPHAGRLRRCGRSLSRASHWS